MKQIVASLICLFSLTFNAQVNCSAVTNTAVGFGFTPTLLPASNLVYNAIGNSTTTVANGQISANCIFPENVTLLASGKVVFTTGFKATSSTTENFKAVVGTCKAPGARYGKDATDVLNNTAVEPADDSSIVLFPNPSSDFVMLNFTNKVVAKAVVIDVLGKNAQSIDNLQHLKELKIDIRSFPLGVYTIKFENNDNTISYKKFIKK
jgi:hypothetical protein